MTTLGLISDTHGTLRPQVLDAFAGVDEILHAGDIGGNDVLARLGALAPLSAVVGNMDPFSATLPAECVLERDGLHLLLLHDMGGLHRPSFDVLARARRAGVTVVIHGHTHRPSDAEWDGIRFVNPGAAGHARGGHPPTVARMTLNGGDVAVDFFALE